MLIDDVEANNFITSMIFEDLASDYNLDFDVVSYVMATDAIKNLEAREEQPDLILLDINMPNMDGWQFLDAYRQVLREANKPSIVVILSSSNNIDDINRAKEHELVWDYATKPFSYERCVEIYKTYLADNSL